MGVRQTDTKQLLNFTNNTLVTKLSIFSSIHLNSVVQMMGNSSNKDELINTLANSKYPSINIIVIYIYNLVYHFTVFILIFLLSIVYNYYHMKHILL